MRDMKPRNALRLIMISRNFFKKRLKRLEIGVIYFGTVAKPLTNI